MKYEIKCLLPHSLVLPPVHTVQLFLDLVKESVTFFILALLLTVFPHHSLNRQLAVAFHRKVYRRDL